MAENPREISSGSNEPLLIHVRMVLPSGPQRVVEKVPNVFVRGPDLQTTTRVPHGRVVFPSPVSPKRPVAHLANALGDPTEISGRITHKRPNDILNQTLGTADTNVAKWNTTGVTLRNGTNLRLGRSSETVRMCQSQSMLPTLK